MKFFLFFEMLVIISTMSAPDTQSQFSANSHDLERFRLAQKLKSASLFLVIGVPLVLAILAYGIYENVINPSAKEEAIVATDASPQMIATDGSSTVTSPDQSASTGNGSVAPGNTTGSGQTPGTSASSQPGGMPEGVNVALNSIEQNGIKSNNYVNMDTSSVPDGTAVRADRSTWTAYGNDLGAVRGTISAYGQTKNGSLTFQLVSGTWKVTGYSIDS